VNRSIEQALCIIQEAQASVLEHLLLEIRHQPWPAPVPISDSSRQQLSEVLRDLVILCCEDKQAESLLSRLYALLLLSNLSGQSYPSTAIGDYATKI
jgi:hypothetical protein